MAIRNYMQNFDMNPLQTVSEMGQGFRRNQIMQQQIDQNQNAMQRVQDQDAMDRALGEAYAAGGNYDEYLKAHPQDFERVHQLQQLKQQLNDKEFGKSAYKALLHLDSNNLSAMDAVIDQNAQMINELGDNSTAETYKQLARDNPELLRHQLAGVMHMSGFDPMQSQRSNLTPDEIKFNRWDNMPDNTPEQKAKKDAFGRLIGADKLSQEEKLKLKTDTLAAESAAAFDTEIAKADAKDYTAIIKKAPQVRSTLNNIGKLKSLNDRAVGGATAKPSLILGRIANAAGVDVEGVPESEMFESISNALVLDKSTELSGALSDGDMAFLKGTVPTLSNTKEGRTMMLDYAEKLAEREAEYIKQATQYRRDHGGRFKSDEFNQQFQKYADENPLFESKPKPIKIGRFTVEG